MQWVRKGRHWHWQLGQGEGLQVEEGQNYEKDFSCFSIPHVFFLHLSLLLKVLHVSPCPPIQVPISNAFCLSSRPQGCTQARLPGEWPEFQNDCVLCSLLLVRCSDPDGETHSAGSAFV